MCKTILSSKKWRSRLSITEKRIRRISRGHHERATFFYALSSVSRIESLSGCTVTLHTVVPRSPPPPSLSICFRFIVSRSFCTRSQMRILFSSFLFFFEKREWRKWMKTDLIMMILIMMILIRRGGPGKSNANNNHLLSAVECIFGLFDAIIILLPTITNKP